MALFVRLLSGLGLFLASLLVGGWCGRGGWLPQARAGRLIRLIVKRLSPLVLCLSFWGLESLRWELSVLPLIGFAVSLAALVPAWGYAKAANLSRPRSGSFLTCAAFSNVGFFGALILFTLYGEAAYSLAMIHMLYFSPAFYAVGFTLAKRYGHARSGQAGTSFSDELRLYPLAGLILGCALNLAHVPRPVALGALNHVLIPLDTALYIIAIGSQVRWEPAAPWLGPALVMSAIKFLYSPLVAWGLVAWLGVTGLPRVVVLVQSALPVAVSPLMLPLLFGLDRRLSNALWIVTTAVAIPWMLVYLPLIR